MKSVDGATIATLLDISGSTSDGGEQGLLGLAISPDGDEIFVNFTNNAATRSSAGTPSPAPIDRPELRLRDPHDRTAVSRTTTAATSRSVRTATCTSAWATVAVEDDPNNHAQRKDSLLGKMLRIDPTPGGGYTIPTDNPFVGQERPRRDLGTWPSQPVALLVRRLRRRRQTGRSVDRRRRWHAPRRRSTASPYLRGRRRELRMARRMEGSRPHIGTEPKGHDGPVRAEAPQQDVLLRDHRRLRLPGRRHPSSTAPTSTATTATTGSAPSSRPTPSRRTARSNEEVSGIGSFGRDNDGELYALSLGGDVYRIDVQTP